MPQLYDFFRKRLYIETRPYQGTITMKSLTSGKSSRTKIGKSNRPTEEDTNDTSDFSCKDLEVLTGDQQNICLGEGNCRDKLGKSRYEEWIKKGWIETDTCNETTEDCKQTCSKYHLSRTPCCMGLSKYIRIYEKSNPDTTYTRRRMPVWNQFLNDYASGDNLSDDEDVSAFGGKLTTVPPTTVTRRPFTATRQQGKTGYPYTSHCITRRCTKIEELFAERRKQAVRNDQPDSVRG